MPNTYTQLMVHVVFSTKNRERTLPDAHRDDLYRYFWGIHNNLGCHLYRIGGMDDHIHILTGMPTTLSNSRLRRHDQDRHHEVAQDASHIPTV